MVSSRSLRRVIPELNLIRAVSIHQINPDGINVKTPVGSLLEQRYPRPSFRQLVPLPTRIEIQTLLNRPGEVCDHDTQLQFSRFYHLGRLTAYVFEVDLG